MKNNPIVSISDIMALRQFLNTEYYEDSRYKDKLIGNRYLFTDVQREEEGEARIFQLRKVNTLKFYDLVTFSYNPGEAKIKIQKGELRDDQDKELVKDVGSRLEKRIYREIISNLDKLKEE